MYIGNATNVTATPISFKKKGNFPEKV